MAPWNDSDDRKLLLSVINLAQINPNWDDVGTQLGRTGESVRQRFMKIKKEAGTTAAASTEGTATAAPAATPKKRKPRTKKPAADDEEDEGRSLTKRAKVKSEPKDEDEGETEA